MMNLIDTIIDRITMYRLVLYVLICLLILAVICSYLGILNYSPEMIVFSSFYLAAICWATNTVFAKVFHAPTNVESTYITALILALIINPISAPSDLVFLGWAGVLAMSSKYILAINKKHLFNPAAIAVVLTSFGFNQSASWWVGNAALAPFVILGGYIIVRKIQREDLAFYFIATVLTISLGIGVMKGTNILATLNQVLFHSSLFFFAFIMLTEPLTTPPTKGLQEIYAVFTGILFNPVIHIGSLYSTPELALVVTNVFSYLVSPKQKLKLYLHGKKEVASGLVDFLFMPRKRLAYQPGQYMEWTLPHDNPDSRGNRRYFTLASSPTESSIRLGVKFYEKGSSFKKALYNLNDRTPLMGAQLAGDFTLPKNKKEKSVFIAGGIGITPFRSMLKYLVDKQEQRDIVLLYSNKIADEIMYADVFSTAYKSLGIRTIYTITDRNAVPHNWAGRVGRISESIIREEIPDYTERTFYLSGPHTMVIGFEQTLLKMGISENRIKKDFFPGFV